MMAMHLLHTFLSLKLLSFSQQLIWVSLNFLFTNNNKQINASPLCLEVYIYIYDLITFLQSCTSPILIIIPQKLDLINYKHDHVSLVLFTVIQIIINKNLEDLYLLYIYIQYMPFQKKRKRKLCSKVRLRSSNKL